MCAKSLLPLGNQREDDVLTVEIRTLLSSLQPTQSFSSLCSSNPIRSLAGGVFAVVALLRGDDNRDAKRRGYLGFLGSLGVWPRIEETEITRLMGMVPSYCLG